jgi:non-ribosomal peptide synthetase component F
MAHGKRLRIGPDTRALQFASYSFDASIQDIFTVLQLGGCICVVSDEDRTSNLPGAVQNTRANYLQLTPTVAALYSPSDFPTVKNLQLGGEPVPKQILDVWCGKVNLFNAYGPAECCINSTIASDIQKCDLETNIGTPLANLCWVVDPEDSKQLLPFGRYRYPCRFVFLPL